MQFISKLRVALVGFLHPRGKFKGSYLWAVRSHLRTHAPGLTRLRHRALEAISPKSDSMPHGVVPFVVLASPRTGSNLLLERLTSQWHSIRSDGEAFRAFLNGPQSASKIIRSVYFTQTGHRFVGCKILADQVDVETLRSVVEIPGIRVIVLGRRNLVRQFVSLKIAKTDGVFSQPSGTKRSPAGERRTFIDVQELIGFNDQRNEWYDRIDEATHSVRTIHVTYEDMETDIEREIQRVADFLGLGAPDTSIPSLLRRQNPEPLQELIENFEGLRSSLLSNGLHDLVKDLG